MKPPDVTLLDTLERRADEAPEALQFRYLRKDDLDQRVELLTRSQLLARARSLAAVLAEHAAPGDRVLLLYPPGLEMFVAFFACLHAGMIAVPMTPPDPQRLAQTLPRLLGIVAQADPRLALSTARVVALAGPFLAEFPGLASLRWVASDEGSSVGRAAPPRVFQSPDSPAFLQFTSGSLGAPKGVTVTHRGLLANLEMIRVGMVMDEATPGAFWLPHHHDMGFIGGGLEFVYCGAPCTMMSPMDFIQRPVRWLRAITRFGAVVGGGPCFAYERCVRRIEDSELEGLDLSTWRVAFVGAEPVRAPVLERFAAKFAPYGFRREHFYPCYGLAESTLFVSGKPMGPRPQPPRTVTLSAPELALHRVVHQEPRALDDSTVRTFVSAGTPRLEARIAVVDPETGARAAEGRIGELWITGPNLATGYWNDPEKTAATFGRRLVDGEGDTYHSTGDLGFVEHGELYVTGRAKELLILGGRNHYPQDLEETIEACHPDLRHGGSAAFSIDRGDDEVLAVVAEVREERLAATRGAEEKQRFAELAGAIRTALLRDHGLVPRELVFLAPGALAKTTSGKKARLDMRRRLLEGSLEPA